MKPHIAVEMANTYSRVVLHIVFAVRFGETLIDSGFRDELQKVMTGLIQHRSQNLLAIYCMPDHTHLLISYWPSISISELVMQIKVASAFRINDNRLTKRLFRWQNGYGVISCDARRLDGIMHYIHNQEEHHRKKKFLSEYRELLRDNGIDFDEKYLFTDPVAGDDRQVDQD